LTTIFLGAGFSKWAAKLPLVSELFDFNINATSEAEERKMLLLKEDWKEWSNSSSSFETEKFIYWCIEKFSHRRSRVIWYLSRRLTDPFMAPIYGSSSALMFDEERSKKHKGVIKANKLLSIIPTEDLKGIITTNYDTLVECALGSEGFNYGLESEQLNGRGKNPQFPWQNAHIILKGKIKLSKLHGSLSWDETQKYTSGKPGRAGKALIVPPILGKGVPQELKFTWKIAKGIINKSDNIIVFGFAFNPYDKVLLDFLKTNGKHIERVLLIDPSPNIDAALDIWPKSIIETINPNKGFYKKLLAWHKNTNTI
jgi:SIR2-like protein